MSHFDSAIKKIYDKVDDLKESLDYSEKLISDLKNEVAKQKQHLQEKDNQIMILETSASETKKQLTYLENKSRRNNLRINGIPENNWVLGQCRRKT